MFYDIDTKVGRKGTSRTIYNLLLFLVVNLLYCRTREKLRERERESKCVFVRERE